jgi:hypothetical protein
VSKSTPAGQPLLQIAIVDQRATPQTSGHWRLNIRWRFVNLADQHLYVLLIQPQVTTIDDPLILDHSIHDAGLPLLPNAPRDVHIVTIGPRHMLEHAMEYPLALPAAPRSLRVQGRFGYSAAAPDPAWQQARNWQQIEQWQRIAESNVAAVTLRP